MELRSCCQFSTVLICGVLMTACGSSDDPSQNTTMGAAAGATGANTNPCNIHSGYAGDELCILPPDPSEGFQLHYGPPSYDAAAVQPYLINPGDEMTDCFFVKSPNPVKV